MPNWCHNTLEISGEVSRVKEIKESIITVAGDFDFNLVDPMPKSMDITSPQRTEEELAIAASNLELYGSKDWYDWSCANWGTKWNACNTYVTDYDGSVTIEYDTAWGPSLELVETLIKKYPDVNYKFSYIEPGCQFAGTHEYHISNKCFEKTSEDFNQIHEDFYGETYEEYYEKELREEQAESDAQRDDVMNGESNNVG